MNKENYDKLEQLIDKHGLEEVIGALSTICEEKNWHLAVTYPNDKSLARWWKKASKRLATVCRNITEQ